MSRSKLIRLYAKNAREVVSGVYESDFNTSFMTNINAVALKTLIFRNNVYNVLATDTFKYEVVGDSTYTAVVTDGFYTLQQLIDVIKPQIQSNLPTTVLTMEINAYSQKVEVSHAGGAATLVLNQDGDGVLNQKMGNTAVSSNITDGGGAYEFTSFADLGGLESVTISIASKSPKTILNVSETKIRHTNSLGVVAVDVPFLGLQKFEQPDLDAAQAVFNFPEGFNKIRFVLRDVDGNVVLNQTNHLVVELMVWFS